VVGIALARAIAAGLCALGVGALVAPRPLARGYGIPAEDAVALSYVRATGVRDLALGMTLGALAFPESRALLATAVGASALVAATDYSLVTRMRPASLAAPLVHGAGTLALLGLWVTLRAGK
jgi:hypothetical protein